MKIAVIGTGMVGRTIASRLIALGHDVRVGTRDVEATRARAETRDLGASLATFADAAAFGEVVFNCTSGTGSVEALRQAGAPNLAGKVLIDVSNPLEFSKGKPPRLAVCNDDSLGETLQRTFPEARVVKALNTMNAQLMVDPARLAGEHDVFVAGNDPAARAAVVAWLREWFGWKAPIDLGDLTAARGLEMWLPLWLRVWGAVGSANFNVHVVR